MTVLDDRRVLAVAPGRTVEQRMAALAHGNVIRSRRAEFKRDVAAGRVNVLDVLEDPPAWIETMKLLDLLLAVPKIGRVKANRALVRLRISSSKTVGGLSVRQRNEIIRWFVWRRD